MKKEVKAASEMPDATFLKHFNLRHMPMAGLSKVPGFSMGEAGLRSYHERLHRLGNEGGGRHPVRPLNHSHIGDDHGLA